MPGFSLFQEMKSSSAKPVKPLPCRVITSLSHERRDSFTAVTSVQLSHGLRFHSGISADALSTVYAST